ncbi:Dam family site-specific DNA-(adenine-N6)-methyltransferase [Mesorhizobium sp. M0601]|uniref:DNA adenine methylase n=1 Tax=unclassified Mesorhizobium TaxID=325217 RepID=UPI00333B9076
MLLRAPNSVISPLKWAGGKRWLANRHRELFPNHFKRYFEPFLGGASIFLGLRPQNSILSDANAELIAMYRAIRDDWSSVAEQLESHAGLHSESYYYLQRSSPPDERFARAAWFLYMNRACYNGLYRVNRSGEFNVPKGSKSEILLKTDDFSAVSSAFSESELISKDFETIVDMSSEGDFVYLDPPYTVKHNYNGFNKYNERLFSWSDQERLAKSVLKAKGRGVKLAVSNANHTSVLELYKTFGEIVELTRHSTIGGLKASRASITEIFVRVGY